MFLFRSGKNYGSYSVTERLPPPLSPPGKKVSSFRERFQHSFQAVDDVFVVRDDTFQYSKGTADLLSPEYGEIIAKMEKAPSCHDDVIVAAVRDGQSPERMTSQPEDNERTEEVEKEDRMARRTSTSDEVVLERASWQDMNIKDRECLAVEQVPRLMSIQNFKGRVW